MKELDGLMGGVQQVVAAAGLGAEESQCKQLVQYLSLLKKWNKTYNLTAVRDVSKMLTHHLADSLSIVQYVSGERVLDVGTGAGLPGIPLAVFLPHKHFVLLDSVSKKSRFLQQVVVTLGLKNVTIINQRVESYNTTELFDVIIARAFACCEKVVSLTQHLCGKQGCYLLQKGVYPADELDALTMPHRVLALDVPGLDANRHLVIIKNGVNDGENHCGS